MSELRLKKVEGIAGDIEPARIEGDPAGDLLLLSWGSTYGAVSQAVKQARSEGRDVSHIHIRHLNPFPRNLPEALRAFRRVLVVENNMGQLRFLVRGRTLVDAAGMNKVAGQPFKIAEVLGRIRELT
jgi:2-oxoglutarate ferredoxin oxidoreductase subunit alpha